MSTQPMMFPSERSERMAYERTKAVYWPYDIEDLRHFCALRDLRIEKLKADNAKLREACAELLEMAESSDPEWLHWSEMYDELRKLGVEV